SGQDQAHVLHLTAAEAEGVTDVRRPSPPRLIRRPSDCRACKAHHLEAAELKVSHFIGRVEAPKDRSNVGHRHAPFQIASAARDPQLGKDIQTAGTDTRTVVGYGGATRRLLTSAAAGESG